MATSAGEAWLWQEAMRDGTHLLHADPERHAAWLEAMREGTRLLHADPERHAAWLEAVSNLPGEQ